MVNRKPVEELLERLFSSWDAAAAAQHLKQLCLDEPISFKPMHSRLRFVTGDCGGVKAVVTDDNRLVNACCFNISVISLTLFTVFMCARTPQVVWQYPLFCYSNDYSFYRAMLC